MVRACPRQQVQPEDTGEGLNFQRDVLPVAELLKADGSNRGGWEFIRLAREITESWAAGPIAQNLDHRYTLKPEEKTYRNASAASGGC
jgi:hypothetical protein